jgi:hypothetical protein
MELSVTELAPRVYSVSQVTADDRDGEIIDGNPIRSKSVRAHACRVQCVHTHSYSHAACN